MTTFTLRIRFRPADLRLVREAEQKLAVLRSLATRDPANVVWLAFSPFEDNTVIWSEAYGLYASQTAIIDREVIRPVTGTAARPGERATLDKEGAFATPSVDPQLSAGQYGVRNRFAGRDRMTLGLSLAATVNGEEQPAGPINAALVLHRQIAVFEPLPSITLFLASPIEPGQVLKVLPSRRTVFGPAAVVHFGAGSSEQCIELRGGELLPCRESPPPVNQNPSVFARTRRKGKTTMTDSNTFPSLAVRDLLRAVDLAQPVSGEPELANLIYGESQDESLVLAHHREGSVVIERGLGSTDESFLERDEEAEGDGPNARALPALPPDAGDLPAIRRRMHEELFPELAATRITETYVLARGHWLPDELQTADRAVWFAAIEAPSGVAGAIIDAGSGEVIRLLGVEPVPSPASRVAVWAADERAVGGLLLLRIKIKMAALVLALFSAIITAVAGIFGALVILLLILQEMLGVAGVALRRKIQLLLKKARTEAEAGRDAERRGDLDAARERYGQALDAAEEAIRLYQENGILQPELADRLRELLEGIRQAVEQLGKDRGRSQDPVSGQLAPSRVDTQDLRAITFKELTFSKEDWTLAEAGSGCLTYTATDSFGGEVTITPTEGAAEDLEFSDGAVIFVCGNVVHLPPRKA